jgi:hypothetical protein
MVNRVQTLRSSAPGSRPPAGTRAPGELYVNWPDSQLGVIDASQNPQDLVAIRFFSTLANYNAGDYVVHSGQLYQAFGSIAAGPFDATKWFAVPDVTISDTPPQNPGIGELWWDSVGGQLYIYYNDGTSSQWVVTGPAAGSYLPTSGGTLSGSLVINGALTVNGANANVTLSPTGTGTVVVNPVTVGHIDNTAIGASISSSGRFTSLSTSATATFNTGTNVPAVKVGPSSACLSGDTLNQLFLGANAYFDPNTGKYYVASNSTQGWGLLVITQGGAPSMAWATSGAGAGNVTGGTVINPAWNYPVNRAGDTIQGSLVVNGNLNVTAAGTFTASSQANFSAASGWGAAITPGGLALQGGCQLYSSVGFQPGTTSPAPGVCEFYNVAIRASTYSGMLGSTTNSFCGNTTYNWGLAGYSNFSGGGGIYSRIDTTAANMCGWLWGTSSLVGSVTTNGSSVSYNTSSDLRLKKNVRHISEDINIGAVIDAIRPVAFEWRNRRGVIGEPGGVIRSGAKIENPDNLPEPRLMKHERIVKGTSLGHGFVAQELMKIAPMAVHAPDDGERELGDFGEENHTAWGVDASKLMPYVIAELQALRKRVAELEGAH